MTAERLDQRNPSIPKENISDFRIEYGKNVPDQALFDDVISYLGEYRFSLPQYSYNYIFSQGKLRDPHRNDPMEDVSQRAIDRKIKKGQSSIREQAEKLAFKRLDQKLTFAWEGQTIIWASPPGSKEDGYGDYGFIFFGKVGKQQNQERNIKMTAIRVENPTIEQFNRAFSSLVFKKINYASAEDFLARPEVMEENISEEHVDSVLRTAFSFKPNEEDQRKFNSIIQRMFPLIYDFVGSVKNPWKTRSEKIKELYSLENYALKLKRDYEQRSVRRENIVINFKLTPRLPDIVGEYGHEPEKVAGSCPTKNSSNSGLTSSNILSKGSFLNDLFGENEWFTCPECGYKADGPVGNTCPKDKGGCGLTKEAYAEETGIACE